MRLPSLIRFSKVLGSQLILAGILLPTILCSQSAEQNLQYRVGDIARETIIAPETIEVDAPANVEVAQELMVGSAPAIYAYQKSASVEVARQLTVAWNQTRDDFLNSLERVFGKRKFRTEEIASDPFVQFVRSYQSTNSGFPFNTATSRRWATGSLATPDLNRYLRILDDFMASYFIRSDDDSFAARANEAVVEVTTIEGPLPTTYADISSETFASVPFNQFLSLSQARSLFEQETVVTSRNLKSYLSQVIAPNSVFLQDASSDRWGTDAFSSGDKIIFEKGDIIVRRGEVITQTVKEALDLMIVSLRFSRMKDSIKIELAREPKQESESTLEDKATPTKDNPAEKPVPRPESREPQKERPQGKLPPILSPTTVAQNKGTSPDTSNKTDLDDSKAIASTYASPSSSLIGGLTRLVIALGLFAVVAVLVFLHFRRSPPVYMADEQPPAIIDDRKQSLMKALTSQLTQTLFRQRQELIKSKEEATAQVAAMEARLAKLQPEIFDKLAAYEKKIKDLEAQLRERGVPQESLDRSAEDEVARPIFDKLKGSAEGEENLEAVTDTKPIVEDNKEVPFPGHAVADDLDEEGPRDLLEEVMEDLEAEGTFDKKIAKGSDH